MDEKVLPKFVLPSPKFARTENEANRTTMHYLTPSGMTLLPRAKQPPPMYGARGSTVPAKYLPVEQSPITSMPQAPPIYKSPPRPEHCHNCGMELANAQDMRRHLEQHETCPAEDCDFAALHNIVERHIEANHITGLYTKVKRVWTAEDTAAWRAERRKKFPTAANVELAKRAKEQRLKRGERLEASKSRFGRREDRARTRPNSYQEKRPKSNKKGKGKSQHVDKKKADENIRKETDALQEETSHVSGTGVPMFRGTGQMLDYEHFKDNVQDKENVLCGLLGMYGSDSEDSEIEAEEGNRSQGQKSPQLETVRRLDSPECSTLENESSRADPIAPNTAVQKNTPETSEEPTISSEDLDLLKENNCSSDEAPDEAPIQRVTESISEPAITKPQFVEPKPGPSRKPAAPRAQKRISGLNYNRARKTTKQNTMLSKLLAVDIRHERNVLLQCVRYVCENNFFGIGASENKDQVKNS
ncbi:nuclear fragile X mental retardation-interacting protein 1 [Drosophila pseudoobscura]|uniref:Nuclear fragile X mental retardation-interacting protein 1 n=1 Tax=Drosophila pseudoobscura pseudoobscura TaxID=46245 RepID=Q2M0D3_DROPS|nr:nuclear fragile X mental retardation-interacting protein 1 [Drosophila pseudoobscura]